MTHPTDEELDALVAQQTRAANKRDEFEALMNADRTVRAITTLRTQIAEAQADKEKLGRELNLARYGQPDFSWQVHKEALAAANARADLTEVQVQALVEALESIRKASLCSGSRETARTALARVKGGEA